MVPNDRRRRATRAALAVLVALTAGSCGGGGGGGGPAATAPVITSQPVDVTVFEGAPAEFAVVATGTAPLGYQWAASVADGPWTDVPGATGSTLVIAAASLLQDGTVLRVAVSNAAGTATSRSAMLSVAAQQAPAVTAHPERLTVVAGDSATFTAAATGAPAPTVQWQRSTDGTTWTDVAGATAPTLVTSPTVALDGCTRYRAVFTNGAGSATTDPALLGVEPTPVTPAYEPFDYTLAANLAALDGGAGFAGGWKVTSAGPTSVVTGANSGTIVDGLAYADGAGRTLVTSGGAWATSAAFQFGQAQRLTASTAGTACTSRFMSYLVKHAPVKTGVDYAAATLGTGYGFGSPAMIGGVGPSYLFTTCFYCSSGGATFTIPGFGAGSVVLLLLRTDFSASGNDTLNAWVNPPLGTRLPAPDAASSDANYGPGVAGLTLIWGDDRSFTFDELRTGLTAESVLPWKP